MSDKFPVDAPQAKVIRALMRDLGVVTAIAFDRHFEEQGFACRPQTVPSGRLNGSSA